MKKLISAAALIAVFSISYLSWEAHRFFRTPISEKPGEFLIDVAPGAPLQAVSDQIRSHGANFSPVIFKIWTRLQKNTLSLRVGEYRIQNHWSAYRAFKETILGKPLLYKITIKEGFNAWDIQNTLLNLGFTLTEKQKKNLIENEGKWFPETYSYQKYDTVESILKSMREQFDLRALPILKKHPWGATPEGIKKLLTLASIVEKESGVFEEQPLIASVFWNRVNSKMKLQSDPTTIYGLLPDFDGNLKRSHLTTPSPFNTYTLPGLPIAPISNPGETALTAVVEPSETKLLFFVARGDGTHIFAETYAEHNQNVKKFQLKIKVNNQSNGKEKNRTKH